MKYISLKKRSNEPDDFRLYRKKTPNATYEGGNFSNPALLETLLGEQGYICAYCMGKLTNQSKAAVEHYYPQQSYKNRSLDYLNLLGVCEGLSDSHPEKETSHHCDKTKGEGGKLSGKVTLTTLDPTKASCEQMITYTSDGEIISRASNSEVTHDLDVVLNLNNKALIKKRKAAMDRAKDLLKEDQATQKWSQALFQKHIRDWLTLHKVKGKKALRPYCMTAVWLLHSLSKRPKYQ